MITPGIIAVGDNSTAHAIQDRDHIALDVGDIIVGSAVVGHRHRHTVGTVGKVQSIIANSHLAQGAAVVDILVGNVLVVAPLSAHTVDIVLEEPFLFIVGHKEQFSAVSPQVVPSAVAAEIADVIKLYLLPIVAGEQVSPGVVIITVGYGVGGGSQCAGGVGIFLAVEDIAGRVVFPSVGEAACLVILPKELVGGVIHITGGMDAVRDGEDIAVTVVGIAVGYIVTCRLQTVGGNLPGGCPLLGFAFGDG